MRFVFSNDDGTISRIWEPTVKEMFDASFYMDISDALEAANDSFTRICKEHDQLSRLVKERDTEIRKLSSCLSVREEGKELGAKIESSLRNQINELKAANDQLSCLVKERDLEIQGLLRVAVGLARGITGD